MKDAVVYLEIPVFLPLDISRTRRRISYFISRKAQSQLRSDEIFNFPGFMPRAGRRKNPFNYFH